MNRTAALRGEFPILVYLLETWYYQDIWMEFKTDIEIWQAAFASAEDRGIAAAIAEVSLMLDRSVDDIHSFVQCFAENNHHRSADNSKIWLQNLQQWLLNKSCSHS
ncbi:hypothetical protein [Shewanella sp.]|uniref:hypothetical protein n=1 Tax=Shewanella sp. TaxID=50422 RepID=UPI003A971609